MDGVADVDRGGVERAEESSNASACTVHQHRLSHGVVVSCRPRRFSRFPLAREQPLDASRRDRACGGGTLHAAHGTHKAHDTDQEDCGQEAANLSKAACECTAFGTRVDTVESSGLLS